MEQCAIGINMVVETKLPVDEFNTKFIQWVESNGWVCCGSMCALDEDGNRIGSKIFSENI